MGFSDENRLSYQIYLIYLHQKINVQRKILKVMITKLANGMMANGYIVENPNFIKRGEYKRTELDDYKDSVDFLITSCGKRYEIIFNHAIVLNNSRSIESISERAYLVTEKALDSLKAKYTWATDF